MDARLLLALQLLLPEKAELLGQAPPKAKKSIAPLPARLIDVACDHAQLAAYAVQRNFVESALAMDLREQPLEKAKKQIALRWPPQSPYWERLQFLQQDGLGDLDLLPNDRVAILGLGGREILDILRAYRLRKGQAPARYVIQAMQQHATLRAGLADLGFLIKEEHYCLCRGRAYLFFVVEQDSIELTDESLAIVGTSQWRSDLPFVEAALGSLQNDLSPSSSQSFTARSEQVLAATYRYAFHLRNHWRARARQSFCTDEYGYELDQVILAELLSALDTVLRNIEQEASALKGGDIRDHS